LNSGITIEEAFKAFDRDFDGKINKADLKWVLINILKIDEETI
jgi:Ca2+-binding EF-hand superfamily protein